MGNGKILYYSLSERGWIGGKVDGQPILLALGEVGGETECNVVLVGFLCDEGAMFRVYSFKQLIE